MNKSLEEFVAQEFSKPGKALDLGAGDFEDVKKLKAKGWNCEGVDLKTGIDLEKVYQSKNAPFDLVISNFVLHFLKDKNQLVKSAYINLKDNGKFFFQDLEYQEITGKMFLTEKEAEEIIKKNGFEILSKKKSRYFDDKEGHKHWHMILEIIAQKK